MNTPSTSRLHCISSYPLNAPPRKICKIISGTLKAKQCNKLLADYHRRFVELIYVEQKINANVTSGHYEMRFYKNQDKKHSAIYCFTINPMSMKFYVNEDHKSKKHPFTFICSSNGVSICFSVHTKYECNAWLSVLQQLAWQFQPQRESVKKVVKDESLSITSPLNSPNLMANDEHDEDMEVDDDNVEYQYTLNESEQYYKQQQKASSYYYKNATLWKTNADACGSSNKLTILSLLKS